MNAVADARGSGREQCPQVCLRRHSVWPRPRGLRCLRLGLSLLLPLLPPRQSEVGCCGAAERSEHGGSAGRGTARAGFRDDVEARRRRRELGGITSKLVAWRCTDRTGWGNGV